MVRKQDITTQKINHTVIFMTWRENNFSSNIFQKYPIVCPTKSFDEKPVRAKISNKGGQQIMATLLFDINLRWSVGHK